jgi:hypothetical protein
MKPSKILINRDDRALIADFGTNRTETDCSTMTSDGGAIHHSVTELCQGACTTKPDVYAIDYGVGWLDSV